MDRHVEFATQLSHLVAVYSRDKVDHATEKAALRAARAAAKHGAIELRVEDGALHAGHQELETPAAELAALHGVLTALGVSRLTAPHHAKQEEVKRIAKMLAAAASAASTPQAFALEVSSQTWTELRIECAAAVAGSVVQEPVPPEPTVPDGAPDTPPSDAPVPAESAFASAEAPVAPDAAAPSEEPAPQESDERVTEPDADDEEPLPSEPGVPLAAELPASVEELVGPAYRELFARLITSSEPLTLRRLLEPVQAAVEQTVREGNVAGSVRLILAMFACEACAEDSEMRRQFVVTMRRLTKPTLTRAYAMLYGDAPECRDDVEQVLTRFADDGAEAVADCIGSAPTVERRSLYQSLLGRLPGANDALLAMLDDQREIVVERAIELIVALRHPDMERALGDLLGSPTVRVRQAAARALAGVPESAFAADALVRAAQDEAPEVRLAAAVALQSRREERLIPTLLPLIDAEEELDVQLALVAVLGRNVTADGVQKLITLATPSDRMLRRRRMPVLRLSAIEGLGEARTPAAMAALQRLLEDKEKEVREAAARLYTRARRQTAAMGMAAVTDS